MFNSDNFLVAFLSASTAFIVFWRKLGTNVDHWIYNLRSNSILYNNFLLFQNMSSNQNHLSRAWASISEAQQNAENTRLKKTGNIFGIITGRFILLVMPSFIFNCIFFICGVTWLIMNEVKCNGLRRKIWICIAVISHISGICDPWVYAIRTRDFRMALK